METIKKRCGKIVLIPVYALGVYHCLYSLLIRQLTLPTAARYLDYFLTLLTGMAFLLLLGAAIRRGTMREFLRIGLRALDNWYFLLLILLFLLMCTGALMTERADPGSFRENLGCLFDVAVSCFVLFPLGFISGRRGDYRFLQNLIDLLTAVYAVLLLCGLCGVYTGREVSLTGAAVFVYKGQLYLGCNPNTTGMICALFMMNGLYRLLSGGRIARIIYILVEILLYTGLALSNSRGGAIAAAVGFGAFTGLCVWLRWNKNGKRNRKLLLTAMCAFLAGAALWYGRVLIQMTLPAEKTADGIAMEVRQLIAQGGAKYGSGRLKLWMTILKDVLPEHKALLLRGCGPYSISEILAEYGFRLYTHNQILELTMAYGLPSSLTFLIWLGLTARQSWRVGAAPAGQVSLSRRVLPLMLLLSIVNNMFEATLLFYRYITGSLFFLVAGYVCAEPDKIQNT